ncbi:hypothetical protein Trydic_g5823 [Trypoxylus dichotomus]
MHVILLIITGVSVIHALDQMELLFFGSHVVVNGGTKYPAVILSGLVSVTTAEANVDSNIELCVMSSEENHCLPATEKVLSNDYGRLLFLKVYLFAGLTKVIKVFRTEHYLACSAMGFAHEPKAVYITSEDDMDCSKCQHMDAIVCLHDLLGIWAGGRFIRYDLLLEAGEKYFGKDTNMTIWESILVPMGESVRSIGANNTGVPIAIAPMRTAAIVLPLTPIVFRSYLDFL